jgi:hypothetical protein
MHLCLSYPSGMEQAADEEGGCVAPPPAGTPISTPPLPVGERQLLLPESGANAVQHAQRLVIERHGFGGQVLP